MKIFYFILFTISFNTFAQTQDSVKVYLWSEKVPLAQGLEEADKPSITVYFPTKEKATGAAVIICPGGGYVTLALDHEGWQVAKWYNDMGITAIILRYRIGTWDNKKYQHPAPFLDVSRAMRLVRYKAKEWNINQDKIGIMGFSAGGHLASCLGTMYDGGNMKAKNKIDRLSSKPNFMVLVYPVITFRENYAFAFGRDVLLGKNASQALIDSMSTETRVSSTTPTTFIMYTDEDDVHAMNGIIFYAALKKNKVPAELHIFERGKHGYGILPKEGEIKDWSILLKNWLKSKI